MKYLLVATIMVVLASCSSTGQKSAVQELADVINVATEDGVVSNDEVGAIRSKISAYQGASSDGWLEILATAVGTLAAGLLGLRYVPNQMIIGKAESKAVDRAAGIC